MRLASSLFGDEGRRGAAGDDAEEVVPAADDAAGVELDEFPQRDRHLLLHRARVVHVARDVEQLRAWKNVKVVLQPFTNVDHPHVENVNLQQSVYR